MGSCKPDPLSADIVHVRKDRRNRTNLAVWFRLPNGSVKMLDKEMIHPIIGSKDLCCGLAELAVNLVLACGQGSLPPATNNRWTVSPAFPGSNRWN